MPRTVCSSRDSPAPLGLASQVADVDAQGVRGRTEVVTPDVLEDRRARQHLARVLEEQLEQQELRLRELDETLAAVDLVGDRIEDQVGEPQRLGALAIVAHPAQQRPQPCLQLAQRERLDEVVVGADVEPEDTIVDRIARGQHQDRRLVAGGAHAPAHLEPVDPGHHHVEDHSVSGLLGEAVKRLLTVDRQLDLVLVESQRSLQCPPHGGLVVYHQNVCHCLR